MSLTNKLLGQPLATSEEGGQKIGVLAGVPSLGLDGLSSAAYGPEAALTILLPLGVLGLNYIGPITLVILALLTILYFSYRQTITAYPNGGGSYTVAHENLGINFGLLAAAALMLDYTLTVAVGISAGVGALISAAPGLHRHTLLLCLVFLALITLVNLRGAREAGTIFALPTYLFVLSLGGVLVWGIFQAVGHGGHPHPLIAPPAIPKAAEGVGLWLLLRAFASGCTAMTGVEAVSNGVTIFADPVVRNAQRTLTVIVAILLLLLAGIAYLCHAYGIAAMDEARPGYQSVISLLLNAVVGRGGVYYVTLGSTLAVLILSANTSYAGFPRLCRLVALDSYLPRAFALLGRRLVYTVGILFLTGLCAVLLIAFKGITDRLIPLYAVGAFLAFTLSQAGMVMHWRKQISGRGAQSGAGSQKDDPNKKEHTNKKKRPNKAGAGGALFINGLGAVCTALALGVILIAKFAAGAWITVLILPALMALFFAVRRHYDAVEAQIDAPCALDLRHNDPPLAVVPLGEWNVVSERALRFAIRLSPDVSAVYVRLPDASGSDEEGERKAAELQRIWEEQVDGPARQAGLPVPKLELLSSPYRRVSGPLTEYLNRLKTQHPGRIVAVIIPELVETRWWEWLLHNHRATALKANLLLSGDRDVVVINVPWYLDRPRVSASEKGSPL